MRRTAVEVETDRLFGELNPRFVRSPLCVEARVGFGFRAAYHQRQTRQDGDMPGITPVLPRAVLDIGVVIDRVFESRLYREDDVGSAGRKVPPLRRTAGLH